MPKRLAITIAGAVSLGSYEAGVLYEIVEAIGQHNRSAADENDKIYIDVLTGASAGGMTATIATQKLMLEADALSGAFSNAFYLPWVADVSLDGLLSLHGNDDPLKSILSSQHVIDISRRYLTARYQTHVDPPRQRHAAAAPTVRLGLSLANLNGIDYALPTRPEGKKFIYTRHQDELTTWIDEGVAADDAFDFWDPLRNACVSCGAFAFAFRVIDVLRHASEFTRPNLATVIAPVQPFSYTDGGTFQNEPLGLAKNLVDVTDQHRNVESRFYLFVAPGEKNSTSNSGFSAATANFRETAFRLIGAIFAQARFQDWIFAEKVNVQIETFNAQIRASLPLFLSKAAAKSRRADTMGKAIGELLPDLFDERPAPRPGHPALETLAAARTRVEDQWKEEAAQLPAERRAGWIDTVLALETVAQLSNREEMVIYGITASNEELASCGLCSFAGFFDRRYRDHDYDVGRAKARAFLTNPQLSEAGQLGPIRYQNPEPLRAIDPRFDDLTLDRMEPGPRKQVRDRLARRAHDVLAQLHVGDAGPIGGIVRSTIVGALVRPQLNKLLKL